MPKITNICITAQLNCKLNIHLIVNNTINSELKNTPFKRCIIRLRKPKATVFVYSNGKMVSIGTKTTIEAKSSLRKVARMIQKIGYYEIRLTNMLVRNIAATYDLKRSLNTRRLHISLTENQNILTSQFDLKVFPNLRLQFKDQINNIKFIISRNGKMIITGIKEETELNHVIEMFVNLIKCHF